MRPRHLPVSADPGGAALRHFRITPNSGHFSVQVGCPKSAMSRHFCRGGGVVASPILLVCSTCP